ncbi:hypothetical protein CERSUDRAFT_71392 [Gelatoporia subvermispora B]|uniref:DUF6533 domain-containing protein n=1 Tax=Ceriporiopsis subvermispora (strain B) TaxID=914234 RepID=M2R4J6_CERS8|nr:hypothetical protein CERSUDRAFT_71392 [Gelatoporia subvermispora B]
MSQTYRGVPTELVTVWKSFMVEESPSSSFISWIQNCCVVAALSLIVYNHVSTITSEFNLMWKRKFNSVTLLFYLNRWFTLMWGLVSLVYYNFLPWHISVSSCIGFNIFRVAIVLFLFTTWAAFASVRIYAVSGGSWWLAFIVFCLSLVPVGTNAFSQFTPISWQVQQTSFGAQCVDPPSITLAQDIQIEISTRVCLIASDLLLLFVTWRKTYGIKRQAEEHKIKTPLVTMLLRDGTVYFVSESLMIVFAIRALLCLNLVNIIGQVTNDFVYAGGFTLPLSSIIISHFLLKLRSVADGPVQDISTNAHISFGGSQRSAMRFASFVDNMGEPLDYGYDKEHPDGEERYSIPKSSDGSHTASYSGDLDLKDDAVVAATLVTALHVQDVEAGRGVVETSTIT